MRARSHGSNGFRRPAEPLQPPGRPMHRARRPPVAGHPALTADGRLRGPGPGRSAIRARAPRPGAAPGAGAVPRPILPARGQTQQPRVSLRGPRDARPHAHHLLRHPDLHRAALPGAAAVDGADPGAGPVRPRGQADAALGRLRPRRHRRVQPARRRGRPTTPRSSSASSACPATPSRSGTTASCTSTASRSRSRTCTTNAEGVPEPTEVRRPDALGRPGGRAVRDGRPPPALRRLARVRDDPDRTTSSGARSSGTGRSPRSGSSRPRSTPTAAGHPLTRVARSSP